jgi:E3 ubiquitin-protein ligase RAD18
MDASFDLPDSTDWLSTSLPSLEPLEASLRCEVCKEFYNNPVITECGHTFCSICIRRCITIDGKCPTCKTGISQNKLVANIAVREIVKRFEEARPKALELAREAQTLRTASRDGSKKRKLDDTDLSEHDEELQNRSQRPRTRRTRGRNDDAGASSPIAVPDTEDEADEEYVPDGMVRCPICQDPMKEELVFTHLNICPGAPDHRATNKRSTRSKYMTRQHVVFG